jgi:MinD-like ATPase involved in chromosome partitioning or flagellar assembly
MWRKFQNQVIQKPPVLPVTVFLQEEQPWMTFPAHIVESVRQMSNRICRVTPFPKRLALFSALRQEGTTYLSRAIGATLAKDLSSSFCVVELNWWWPTSDLPTSYQAGGLAAVMTGQTALEEALIRTAMPNLTILPAGNLEVDLRSTISRGATFNTAIEYLQEHFDHLILDIPAILSVNEAIPLASQAETCCFVIQQGVTTIENVKLALDEVSHLPISGVVMNQVKFYTPPLVLNFIPQQ